MSFIKTLKWFSIVSPVLNIVSLLVSEQGFLKWLPSELTFIVLSVIVLYFCYWKNYTCPECRKLFALQKTKEEIIDQENVSVLVETKMRDNRQNDSRNVLFTCPHHILTVISHFCFYQYRNIFLIYNFLFCFLQSK